MYTIIKSGTAVAVFATEADAIEYIEMFGGVIEDRRARWNFVDGSTKCSNCKNSSDKRTAYCPHCGRSMKNGNKEV